MIYLSIMAHTVYQVMQLYVARTLLAKLPSCVVYEYDERNRIHLKLNAWNVCGPRYFSYNEWKAMFQMMEGLSLLGTISIDTRYENSDQVIKKGCPSNTIFDHMLEGLIPNSVLHRVILLY